MAARLPPGLRSVLAALALGAAALPARAHDSWLSPARLPAKAGEAALELSTGNRYPVQDVGSPATSLAQSACLDGLGLGLVLRPGEAGEKWLTLRAALPADSRGSPVPLSCWIELKPYEIELQPRLIPVYLNEIRAPASVRETWAAMQARKLPWRESFRKYARIEMAEAGPATAQQRAAARKPAGLALELVVLGDGPVAIGEELVFQLLRDGRPLAGFPIELVSERSAIGIWRETDAEGKLRHKLPFAGRWLLRGTDLRLSAQDADRWESRFVTLAIEAAGPPPPAARP